VKRQIFVPSLGVHRPEGEKRMQTKELSPVSPTVAQSVARLHRDRCPDFWDVVTARMLLSDNEITRILQTKPAKVQRLHGVGSISTSGAYKAQGV
jgi:hypothetical protein